MLVVLLSLPGGTLKGQTFCHQWKRYDPYQKDVVANSPEK